MKIEEAKNKIIQGDALEELKKLPEKSVDLVVTSPPYNCGINYDSYNDNKDWDEYYKWCRKWLKELYRVFKDDGRFCLNHYLSLGQSNNRHSPLMDLNWISREIGFRHHGLAVWTDRTLTKRTAWGSWLSASAPYINSPYEGILILYKNEWKKRREGKTNISSKEFMEACSGIWDIQPDRKQLTPANFPIELSKKCIKLLSFENDMVLDPFIGSGTTAVACKQLNRNYIGIEISKKYCKIAREELEQTNINKFINNKSNDRSQLKLKEGGGK